MQIRQGLSRQTQLMFFGEDLNICVDFYCLIRGWCPIQFPTSFRSIDNVDKFELFIKAVVTFPSFEALRRNYDSSMNKVRALNTFTVMDILEEAGVDSYQDIQDKGAVISMTINFDCMHHWPSCNPSYTFQQLDNDFGFSFLYNVYTPPIVLNEYLLPESRTTFEYRGIRIVLSISGGMHRFNGVGLLLSFGSFIGLLAVATQITDFVLLNIHPNREDFVFSKYRFLEHDRTIDFVDKELLKHLTRLGYY